MKKLVLILSLFLSFQGFAQITEFAGTTRAVIVGISDYQSEAIPDLKYADKDAEAFAQYLRSSAGGSLHGENIKLLLNEDATFAAFYSELDWLVEESKEGDQAIIYFSGHGDVESKVARQPGFLLCYDSPPKIYMAGSCPLFYLQLIIETLSTVKNVKTLVITDACRAGKLAGSEIGGTQATAANLAKQYANEIKILSCQPDEFSLEGEQWGGGRGVFSYHLIEGLIGLADENKNFQVNLLELENYLERIVPDEAAPQSQIPMTIGSKGTKVAFVDEVVLAELKSLKERQLPTLAAIESKGIEEALLMGLDSLLQKKYEDFVAALEDDNLLDAENDKLSADQLYRELIREESLAKLHRLMTRQLATALQDDAQQAINAYLLANPKELQKRWEGDTEYAQYPRYLGRAADLLGEEHYMYEFLKAKQLYFEGLSLRLEADRAQQGDSLYHIAIKKLEMALGLENRAPFFYNELGVLNTRLKNSEKAIENFEQAIAFAPEWGLPYVNYSVELFYSDEIDKAIEYGEKAAERMPDFPQVYSFLAWISANNWQYSDRINRVRNGIDMEDDYRYELIQFNTTAQNEQLYARSLELLKKAIAMDSTYAFAYHHLAFISGRLKKTEIALKYQLKVIELDPDNSRAFLRLGDYYGNLKKYEKGEKAYLKAIALDENNFAAYSNLGVNYAYMGDVDKEIQAYKKAIELGGEWVPHSLLSGAFLGQGQLKEAEEYSIKATMLAKGYPKQSLGFGRFYTSLNRPEDAEWGYLKALEVKPDYKDAMYWLITLYSETEQFDKALKFLKIAFEKEPNNNNYLIGLVRWNIQLGNLEEAEIYSNKFHEKWSAFGSLGYGYLYAKKFERADYYFKKARAIKPGDPVNDWNRCCYYSIKGESKKAIKAFSAALENGFKDFNHIHTDKDAIRMRAEPEFPVLMAKYFPGQVFEGQPVITKNTEPIYYWENCLLLAEFYESEGEHDRAKFLRKKAEELKRK